MGYLMIAGALFANTVNGYFGKKTSSVLVKVPEAVLATFLRMAMAMLLGCDVFSMFPLFFLEKIGCYNWGFVNGRQQCHEPWQMLWEDYEAGTRSVDFTKWFHDLYRPSHRPYDPAEIRLIKDYCRMADEDWERK